MEEFLSLDVAVSINWGPCCDCPYSGALLLGVCTRAPETPRLPRWSKGFPIGPSFKQRVPETSCGPQLCRWFFDGLLMAS